MMAPDVSDIMSRSGMPAPDESAILRALLERSDRTVFATDLDGRLVLANPELHKALGALHPGTGDDPDLDQAPESFLTPDTRQQAIEARQEVLRSGHPCAIRGSILRADGSVATVRVAYSAVRSAAGDVIGVLGTAEEDAPGERYTRIQETVVRILALFSHAADRTEYARGLTRLVLEVLGIEAAGLRVVDRTGHARYVASEGFSASFLAREGILSIYADDCLCIHSLTGRREPLGPLKPTESGSWIVQDLVDAVAHATDEARSSLRDACLAEGFRSLAVLPVRHGGRILGALHLADRRPNVLDADQMRMIESLRPVVGEALWRFSVEDALRESRSRLDDLFNTLPLPIWSMDADRRVRYQNRAHRDVFGPSPEGAVCHRQLFGQALPCSRCPLDRVLEGETVRTEWTAPGNGRTYDVFSVPLAGETGDRGLVEILVDVTDRVRAEAHLRDSQRMESLGSLSAGIAHDFNNIIAGIIGYAQLGEQRADGDARFGEPFRQIRLIGERGAELTRKILAFSRRQPLKFRPVDLNALVVGLQPMLVPLTADKVEVRLDLAPRAWAVQGDRSALEQVVFNLCVNAAEAMSKGGTLTLSTANIDPHELAGALGTDEGGNGVVLRVSDTGHGMTPEVAEHVFEPFFTTKGRGRGTGLGLSVSYGIVKQHGGHIRLESHPGRGTTVLVYLPAASATPSKMIPVLDAQPRPARRYEGHALVVEDERGIRELVALLLRDVGLVVDTAASGDEALSLVLGRPEAYDVVVTDIAMPGMSGCELVQRIATARPGTGIVFMTGCSDASLRQYGLPEDALLLRKPFQLEELAARVEQVMDGGFG